MFFKINKWFIFISLIFLLIPTVCAVDNDTIISNGNAVDMASISVDGDVLTASNDYYFNASVENDGDGSISNPYKYLTVDRIKANSNLFLANGEYQLDGATYIDEVKIIGSDVDKTIIKYDGVAFTVNNHLTVRNITFMGLSITNHAKLDAYNAIFEDGYGSKPDSYGNNYGGAIYTYENNGNAYVNVDNCTFKNNHAQYGGAIYMGAGVLNVSDSLFFNNYAYNYGGSIACDNCINVSISRSKFYNSLSIDDAGGSIYIKCSNFAADEIYVANSSSTFGGAITTLNTHSLLTGLNMINNTAKYDGGAIYHIYGNFTVLNSIFINNSASNGGALFIDNSTQVLVRSNTFTNNSATNTGGAIYSLLNKISASYGSQNNFNDNKATFKNDYYDTSTLNLIIGNGNYTMYKVDVEDIDALPSKYSLIDEGYTTVVKDQQASGNCWAFTAISVLESCILKAGGENLDLSEENMKNIIEMYSDYGWKMETNGGGYDYMEWGYLVSWLGPVNEIEDVYDDKSTLSPLLNSIMHVQNIKFLKRDSYTDNDEIKKAILNYGAVGTGIYYDSYYYDSLKDAYYCWYSTSQNHAVTIVGWDDNFSKSNFKGGYNLEGDGAWIVRNSWGPSWGKDGYFYVSYYDKNFATPNVEDNSFTFILNDTIRFDKNYQYDIAGITDYFLNSSSKVWYKNKFTATSNEYLAAISTYFEKTCDWTASVFVNGEMKDVLSGKSDAGYFTFNLNRLIPLKKGDVFEVVFNITTSGEAAFPISEIYYLNKLVYSPGVSYASWDGENWVDLYNFSGKYSTHTYYSQVACIKSFTVSNPINTLTDFKIDFKENSPFNITAIIKDEYGNLLKYGVVTFNINGENRIVNVTNGMASLLYDFNEKINSVSATFNAEGYNSSSKTVSYEIPKIKMDWNLEISQDYNNVNVTVVANRLLNESVIAEINANETLLELINGTGTLKLNNLTNDHYSVYIALLDESLYGADPLYGDFTIDLSKTTIISNDLTMNDAEEFIYEVTLLDEYYGKIPNKEIIFAINNTAYVNKTDENGQARIFIKLNNGVYDVNVTFRGDNDYFSSNSKNTIKVKSKIWINLDINAYKNNAFINVYGSNHINETFTVLVNNKPYYIDSKDGIASLRLSNLSADVYNVNVSLDESEYEFNEVSSQFIIYEYRHVEINNTVEISGGDAIINIEVGNASGNVVVIIDGVSDIVKLDNGLASYTFKDIQPGNHSLVIIYDGDGFEETFKSEIFNVPKRESRIELILNNTKVDVNSTIIANVMPEASGLVSIDINGTLYLLNLSESNALDMIFDKAGEYLLFATYWGDENYNLSKSDEYKLIVSDKAVYDISIDVPESVKVGESVEFNISGDVPDDLECYIDGEIQHIENDKIIFTPLKAGLHVIEMVSGENDDYYAFYKECSFNVVKNDAIIFINLPQTITVGENIIINPVTNSDGSLVVRVNGELINSSYVIPIKSTFVVTVESSETEMFNRGFNYTTFTSIKRASIVNINVTSGKARENSIITVNVTDGASGIVVINVNGTSYALDLNKTNVLEVNLTKPGEYAVFATYLGDDKFQENKSGPEIISVREKLPANIKVELPEDIKVGDRITINITSDSDARLVVIINGEVQEVISENEIMGMTQMDILKAINAKVVYDVSHDGIYNVTVRAMETKEYLPEMVTKIFEVTKKDAILEIYPIDDAKLNDIVHIHVSCQTDGNLTIKVNGKETAGEYLISKAGIYTITVESAETDSYKRGFAISTFDVADESVIPSKQKVNVTISVSGNLEVGEDVNVNVAVSVAVGNVSVIVDGIDSKVTLENGCAEVPIPNITAGSHSVVVIYLGDETHDVTYGTYCFTVLEKPVIIPIHSQFSDIVVNQDLAISMTLKDEMGNSIAKAPILYYVNGIEKTTVTNENGLFVVSIKNGDTVVIKYEGNATVIGTNSTLTLNVPDIPAAVKIASRFNITGNSITLKGYAIDKPAGEKGMTYFTELLDVNGNPIANAYIEFAINDKIHGRTTYENGSFAPYELNMLRAGRYTLAFSFGGNDQYNNAFAVVCIDLDKKPITIKASAKTYKASEKTKKYTVSLSTIVGSSADGKAHLRAGLTVSMLINGITYTGKTNSKGQVSFNIKITKKGKYTAKISYAGDQTYNSASKSVIITIK